MLRVLTTSTLIVGSLTVGASIGHAENLPDSGTSGTIKGHMQVVGSDMKHVGTVDKYEGSNIKLTKDDPAANGMHHSIPSSMVGKVTTSTVMLSKTAQDVMAEWSETDRPNGDMQK